ncbi:unnamed protein product, partial [marine sediment metagenome]
RPEFALPNVKPGKAMAFEAYRFQNKRGSAGVMLAIDKFSFYEKKYEGHKKFISKFNRL